MPRHIDRLLLVLLLALAPSCDRARTAETELRISVHSVEQLVPGPTLPAEVVPMRSNNNLHVLDFNGRTYLVFRTGPTHFASPKIRMYIVSKPIKPETEERWVLETEIALGTDIREPSFFAHSGRLWLYFAQLGSSPTAFEPGKTFRIERKGLKSWSTPEEVVFTPGFIPWHIKWLRGVPYMIGYDGGENIYLFNGEPLNVYLLTTDDGRSWRPVDPNRPVVLTGGNSETDIEFDEQGNLFAIARNEAGDEGGFGSRICTAPAGDIANWRCETDPRKYDSPLLFRQGSEIYLVGRRNISDSGHYDLGQTDKTMQERVIANQLSYSAKPKRCALWRIDREHLRVVFLQDLPSRGDTCFPSILRRGPNSILLFNYSSDIRGPDIGWLKGQNSPSYIYRMSISFSK